DIEALDLRPGGGADAVYPFNLATTDLTAFALDLAGAGGGDDGAADEVGVPLSAVVGSDGAVATVNGLGAQVRVVDAGGSDRLRMVGTAGTDAVSLTGSSGPDLVGV